LMGFSQWNDCSVNLLGLVARVLCVSTPSGFNERNGNADFLLGTPTLHYKIEIVFIARLVYPSYFRSGPGWPWAFLVEVQTVLSCECSEKWFDSHFQNVTDDLSESV